MNDDQKHHDHDHDHEDKSPQAIRTEALESLLIEKGLLSEHAVDDVIANYAQRVADEWCIACCAGLDRC